MRGSVPPPRLRHCCCGNIYGGGIRSRNPKQGLRQTGGYSDIFYTGLLGPIIHADVESLYPSIMISKNIVPRTDALKVFHSVLEHLTKLRLETKKRMRDAENDIERSRLDAMQSSFKIVVNSFYGYLGYARALFNDYTQADVVTTTGQELLRQMIHDIGLSQRKSGGSRYRRIVFYPSG